MQDEETDDVLIERSRRGDRAAFGQLAERHAPSMLRLARAMSPSSSALAIDGCHAQRDGGVTCAEVLAALGDYVDAELSADVRPRIGAHLAGCSVCERFGGRYTNVVRTARARLGAAAPVDMAHLARIRTALGVELRGPPR